MKIIFLNIWDCNNTGFAKEFIRNNLLDTDIFCFQEACEKTKWLCKDLLQDYILYSDYKYVSDKDSFPTATYTRKTLEIVSNRSILADIPMTGLVLYTQVKTPENSVHICNVHGISKPGDKLDTQARLLQSEKLIQEFKDLKGLKIIGGDFNLEHDTQSVRMFEEAGYRNLIKDFNISTTRNKYVWDRYPENKQYFSDYIFISKDVVVKDFVVPDSEASDHLPLILTIG